MYAGNRLGPRLVTTHTYVHTYIHTYMAMMVALAPVAAEAMRGEAVHLSTTVMAGDRVRPAEGRTKPDHEANQNPNNNGVVSHSETKGGDRNSKGA